MPHLPAPSPLVERGSPPEADGSEGGRANGAWPWRGGTLAEGGFAGGGGYGSALLHRRPRKTTLAA